MTVQEFEDIYRTHYHALYHYAGDFIDDKDVCRDILSDVFARFWANRDRIGDIRNPGAMLRTYVRNACISWMRERQVSDRYAEFLKLSAGEGERIDSVDERIDILGKAIESLPEKTRFALEQCSLNNLTYKQTGELMGISADGVKRHIVKAYASIRSFFKNTDQ